MTNIFAVNIHWMKTVGQAFVSTFTELTLCLKYQWIKYEKIEFQESQITIKW